MAPWGGPPVRASENWRGDVVGQKGQTTKNSTQFFLSIIMKYNFLLFAMFIFLVPACQNVVPDVIYVLTWQLAPIIKLIWSSNWREV